MARGGVGRGGEDDEASGHASGRVSRGRFLLGVPRVRLAGRRSNAAIETAPRRSHEEIHEEIHEEGEEGEEDEVNDDEVNDDEVNDDEVNDDEVNDDEVNDDEVNDDCGEDKDVKPAPSRKRPADLLPSPVPRRDPTPPRLVPRRRGSVVARGERRSRRSRGRCRRGVGSRRDFPFARTIRAHLGRDVARE